MVLFHLVEPFPEGACPFARTDYGCALGDAHLIDGQRIFAHTFRCWSHRCRTHANNPKNALRNKPTIKPTTTAKTMTGPAMTKSLDVKPVIIPSRRKSMALETMELANPVMGMAAPAPP